MKITFYKNLSTKNTAVKNIEQLFFKDNAVLKSNCDMLNPTLELRLNENELNNLYKYVNYFYIDKFDR